MTLTADTLRDAITRAPRATLPSITQAMYAALGASQISDADAEALDAAIAARRAVLSVAPPAPKKVGSKPRTDESMARRRRWAASGRMPPSIAERYTLAEQAVLAVVAAQVARYQRCDLASTMIAAIAGVSPSSAKATLRLARDRGHLLAQVRPKPGGRHDTTIRTIIAPEWVAWLKMPRRDDRYVASQGEGGGVKSVDATSTGISGEAANAPGERRNQRRKGATGTVERRPLD